MKTLAAQALIPSREMGMAFKKPGAGEFEERAAAKEGRAGEAALMHEIPSGPIVRLCDFFFCFFLELPLFI